MAKQMFEASERAMCVLDFMWESVFSHTDVLSRGFNLHRLSDQTSISL